MDFIKNLIRNIVILVACGFAIYLVAPSMMSQVYSLFGSFFGPLAIIMIVVLAIPKKRKTQPPKTEKNKNLAGESTNQLADKRYKKMIIYGIVGVAIFILLILIINNSKALGIGGAGILILLVVIKIFPDIFDRQLNKKVKEVTRARKGAKAEVRVDSIFLDMKEDYFIINDIETTYGNIDHVIIKRDAGIFLIETKSHYGKVTVQDNTIYINEHLPEKDFISQTMKNTYWLRDRLKECIGFDVWVHPIIVFTNAFVSPIAPIKGINIVNIKFLIKTMERDSRINSTNDEIWDNRDIIYADLKQ
ncbi:MAG: hypothetical protein CVU42_03160 [Chloroflexi bacterium HGW-Chloroflexi-4]|jgi:hypothetical protein|nr:MAG: hypothetical protein CVU42_03160 [Chloroflexi bacterium HGW-Chloroflexi-4]